MFFLYFSSPESKIMRIHKKDVTLLLKWHALPYHFFTFLMPIAITNLAFLGNKMWLILILAHAHF